jgi:alginate O-acetyltransferase complex protein AlgI
MLLQISAYVLGFLICAITLAKSRSRRLRQSVLLVASIGLYLTWTPWFAAVLLASAVMNFLVGLWLRRQPSGLPLSVGVLLNLAFLGVFKYLPEFAIHSSSRSLGIFLHLALPLGISFWTFQAVSYLLDLYREELLDPSFVEFLLYMSFFPVTISGPICRLPEMLPQFRSDLPTPTNEIGEGLRRIAAGILMMQVAKLLGRGILGGDGILSGFDHLAQWTGPDVWCLAFGFGLQLFFDFAGYSHIAIGAAKALGFTMPENFERPFASSTPSVFWTRWHMSLSFWIRDYVFLPLATVRREIWWRNFALVLAMVLFGLWHQASWLFLLWGCYHGVLLVLHRQVQQVERRFNWEPASRFWTPLSWIVTMSLISLGWIFFRAHSVSQGKQMLSAVFSPATYGSHYLSLSLYLLVSILALGYALVVFISRLIEDHSESSPQASGILALALRRRWFWILPLYALVLILVLMITFTQEGGAAQFMYSRF